MNEQTRQANLFISVAHYFGLLSLTGCNSKTEPAASAPNQAAETICRGSHTTNCHSN